MTLEHTTHTSWLGTDIENKINELKKNKKQNKQTNRNKKKNTIIKWS